MDPASAERELRFIRGVVDRTHRRIDPHAFHFVHWGLIVLVWYPLANWLTLQGDAGRAVLGRSAHELVAVVGVVALVLGIALSTVREWRLSSVGHRRVAGENTFISRQVNLIVAGCIATGAILSFMAPAFELVDGRNVPILWGLVYANLAFMTGVAYDREFLWSGAFIFAGVLLAIAFQESNGYILGPFMGLGMVIPGLRAERRVRRLQAEDDELRQPV